VLEPVELVRSDFAERHRSVARRLLIASATLNLVGVLGDELRHPYGRALLVVPAVGHSPAAAVPFAGANTDDPGGPDAALHWWPSCRHFASKKSAPAAPTRTTKGAGWEASDKPHIAARVPPSNGQATAQKCSFIGYGFGYKFERQNPSAKLIFSVQTPLT
jgi:hypothetical protein